MNCKEQLVREISLHIREFQNLPVLAKVSMKGWVELTGDHELISNAIVFDHVNCQAHFDLDGVQVYLDPRLPDNAIIYYNEY